MFEVFATKALTGRPFEAGGTRTLISRTHHISMRFNRFDKSICVEERVASSLLGSLQ